MTTRALPVRRLSNTASPLSVVVFWAKENSRKAKQYVGASKIPAPQSLL
jgi:hypothetical protein